MMWLLDTHTLIWALFRPAKLGTKVRTILENGSNLISVSPISYWEISLKVGLGKLDLPGTDPSEIPRAARELGFIEESLSSEILATYHQLPSAPNHRDPFDRLLIWQAICRKQTFLSKDPHLEFYRPHGLTFDW
jgi:PIN domain nuclease of toxin-antitoxin system